MKLVLEDQIRQHGLVNRAHTTLAGLGNISKIGIWLLCLVIRRLSARSPLNATDIAEVHCNSPHHFHSPNKHTQYAVVSRLLHITNRHRGISWFTAERQVKVVGLADKDESRLGAPWSLEINSITD